ncbi:MAG: tRNA 2-thiouridine(34) synthase MnmA [bacterium]|nr:tRNA 2-thiouridine(34) synthase MnmA [bacterium]
MRKKVLVGMSGGVDSSVSALLLKEEGYDVSGVFMKVWDEKYKGFISGHSCFSPDRKDTEDVKSVAEMLGIKLYIVDLVKEFSNAVLDYFKKEYIKGRTPNPCVVCNRYIKFGILIEKMREMDSFDFFATGHYANVGYNRRKGRYILKKGMDKNKDQSYFLFLLTQTQLSNVMFPLGKYTKTEVRSIAERYKLPVSDKEESQDFIDGDIKKFFSGKEKQGDILDIEGNVIGRHKGIVFYTVGQRKGMGIAKGIPLYVIEIDTKHNRIVVGDKRKVYKSEFLVEKPNWVSIEGIKEPLKAYVRIRYKHTESPATIYPPDRYNYSKVVFDKPQWAITPGQAAVFYEGDVLLGGGFITTVYR